MQDQRIRELQLRMQTQAEKAALSRLADRKDIAELIASGVRDYLRRCAMHTLCYAMHTLCYAMNTLCYAIHTLCYAIHTLCYAMHKPCYT